MSQRRFAVTYATTDGRDYRSYYQFTDDANKAQAFLRALGIQARITRLAQPWVR